MSEQASFTGRRDGIPVYSYPRGFSTPPVSLVELSHITLPGLHIHEFPVLVYHRGTGLIDVVAAGSPVDPHQSRHGMDAVAIFFDPAALGGDARSPWPTWRAHPLLFPFLHGHRGGLLQLEVPTARREFWATTLASIETECHDRRDGYSQASVAYLTVLLIELARMSPAVADDLRRSGEPLLAKVFDVIEQRLDHPLTLRDVAQECGLTPGHLTTVVRRRTGRTVQEWIVERRMAEARSLLVGTDLTVQQIAARLGMADSAYFSRVFRRAHGDSPRSWRAKHVRTA